VGQEQYMKYACSQCDGHVELEGDYSGQEMVCPHCQATVQFRELTLDVVTGAQPPILGGVSLNQVAGPDQDTAVVAQVVEQLRGYCTPDESVLRVVVQSKLMAVSIKPDLIAATTRRIIILRRGLFSCQMWDALWVDVYDVEIAESITGATLSVTKTSSYGARLDKLPKLAAREFYRFCQSREEVMRAVRYAQQIQTAAAGAARVNVNIKQ
jgi:DNA-directed RNA polymerase subunit RPC12/RpoP